MSGAVFTLPKEERLSGTTSVKKLMQEGRWSSHGFLKYCVLPQNGKGFNRIAVSVPKKFFKRAVKRNLLKRRIRDAYRRNKGLLSGMESDILFTYNSAEVMPSNEIEGRVCEILNTIKGRE